MNSNLWHVAFFRFMVKFTVNSMIVSCPGPVAEKQPQIVTLRLLCVAISARRFS